MAVITRYGAICDWCGKEGSLSLTKDPEKEGLPNEYIYFSSPYGDSGRRENPEYKEYEGWVGKYVIKETVKLHHFLQAETKIEYKYLCFCSEDCYKQYNRTAEIVNSEWH